MLATLGEDVSSVSSAYVRESIAACNSSSRQFNGRCLDPHMWIYVKNHHMFIYVNTHMTGNIIQ